MDALAKWIAAVAAALAAHAWLFWGVGLGPAPAPEAPAAKSRPPLARVSYLGSPENGRSPRLVQQIELFDPRPLLLPTKWNHAATPQAGIADVQPAVFDDIPPAFQPDGGDFVAGFGNDWRRAPGLPEAALELERNPFATLGYRPQSAEAAPREAALFLEVVDPATGRRVLRRTLQGPEAREILALDRDWTPATLLATVRQSFLVKRLALAGSSGSEEIDQRLLDLAASGALASIAVPDGAYFLLIGP